MGKATITNDRLRSIKGERGLTQVQLGQLLGLKVFQDKRKGRKATWKCPQMSAYLSDPKSQTFQPFPSNLLELLELKLEKMDIGSKKSLK